LYNWYNNPKPPKPLKPANGIKAKTRTGKFGESWWAKKWIGALESFGFNWQSRLQRGRKYARDGQVLSLEARQGMVVAVVQGSATRPYTVTIQLSSLSDEQWEKVTTAMAGQAIFAAKLLAGEMPPDIEEAFRTADVPLFPQRMRDIEGNCSCPDYMMPCKHIAAVCYLMGELFDSDPFLLFMLRGRTKKDVMTAMRTHRKVTAGPAITVDSTVPVAAPASALGDLLSTFYTTSEDLNSITPKITEPTMEAPLLRRLGPPPGDIESELFYIYEAMTRYAQERILGEE
jgi:uncharacterized Zn finger protein